MRCVILLLIRFQLLFKKMIQKQHINWWDGLDKAIRDMLRAYTTLGVPLVGVEKSAMIEYVEDEVRDENYINSKEYETVFPLAGVNALVDYVGFKLAIDVNAPTHNINGKGFNGVNSYINSNFTPSIDGINISKDELVVSLFLYNNTPLDSSRLFGGIDGISNFFSRVSGGILRGSQNSVSDSVFVPLTPLSIQAGYSFSRNAVTSSQIFEDGILLNGKGTPSIALTTVPFYVGCVNTSGVPNYFKNCTISNFMINNTLNQVEHQTNITKLLTALGTLP